MFVVFRCSSEAVVWWWFRCFRWPAVSEGLDNSGGFGVPGGSGVCAAIGVSGVCSVGSGCGFSEGFAVLTFVVCDGFEPPKKPQKDLFVFLPLIQ